MKLLVSIIGGIIFGVIFNSIFTLIVGYFISGQCLTGSQFCNPVIISVAALSVKISWVVFIAFGIIVVHKLISKIIK